MLDLTHIHPDLRSGRPSSGRRLVALVLCALLVLGTLAPGVAAAREDDSEGEGTGPSVEIPSPDFDPGGEETGLENSPAGGEVEEEVPGPVEPEAEVEIEAPPVEEVTPPAPAPSTEANPPAPSPAPTPEPVAPEYESAQPEAGPAAEPEPEPEPVANETITAPPPAKASGGDREDAAEAVPPEAAAPSESSVPIEPEQQQEAPASPQPSAVPPAEPARSLTGKDPYIVRPGDCLWHIAEALLPPGADVAAIEGEVARLWRLNQDRIGTGDPNLIYPGTTLRLR